MKLAWKNMFAEDNHDDALINQNNSIKIKLTLLIDFMYKHNSEAGICFIIIVR